MTTTMLAVSILMTAFLSAGLTWALAWQLYRRGLEARIDAQLLGIQEEFEARVKSGVLAAGNELLPALREQVKLGFQDALRQTQTGELVETTASAVNLGTELLSQRLGNLFALKPGPRPRK